MAKLESNKWFSLIVLLTACLGASSQVSGQTGLSTIVGIYDGEIESITMVQASTEFYFHNSSRLMGRYRYQDEGAWDHGVIFNIRQSQKCDVSLEPTGGGSVGSSGSSGGGSLPGLYGAAGKKKKKSQSQGGSSLKLGELCITGIWRDFHGQGPVKLVFSPTRDSFHGYYRKSPEDEWAIWNGASIPKASSNLTSGSSGAATGSGSMLASTGASVSTASTGVVSVRFRLTNQKTDTLLVADSITESLVNPDSSASDQANYEEFSSEGMSRTKEIAIRDAYEFAVEEKVADRVGEQSAGDIGEWFDTEARNFDKFRRRYFTPDTSESCSKQSSGQFSCVVTGRLKVLAISADLREFTKKSARKVPGGLAFFFAKQAALDKIADAQPQYKTAAEELITKLAGAFSTTGQTVVVGDTAMQAISDGKIDFGLSLLAITYDNISAGPNQSEAVILDLLAEQVVEQVALSVSEAVANSLEDRDNDALTRKNDEEGKSTFYIRLVGIDQGRRKELRSVRRLIRELFPDSSPSTDPEQSDSNQTTIVFSSAEDANHDDVLDVFFEKYEEKFPQFDGEYHGNNEYYLYFQLTEVEVLCPSDASGTYPDCNCGVGRRFELSANNCVRICPTGAGGAYPNCDCGENAKYERDSNACVKVCPKSASGTYPDCKCGIAIKFDPKANVCKDVLGNVVDR